VEQRLAVHVTVYDIVPTTRLMRHFMDTKWLWQLWSYMTHSCHLLFHRSYSHANDARWNGRKQRWRQSDIEVSKLITAVNNDECGAWRFQRRRPSIRFAFLFTHRTVSNADSITVLSCVISFHRSAEWIWDRSVRSPVGYMYVAYGVDWPVFTCRRRCDVNQSEFDYAPLTSPSMLRQRRRQNHHRM